MPKQIDHDPISINFSLLRTPKFNLKAFEPMGKENTMHIL
ncbi:hypothetical protein HAL07_13330 [Helicobacter ailurogastricus]|uniref:Uncharacterized protein n=1 Tax=Helicobacter ailurogastricus TaxID=1578720 RepID=A0A0K2Y1R5_9HELI|nr:hypothetical protein HAL07_13330 [Helicobacter ailurogastricus]